MSREITESQYTWLTSELAAWRELGLVTGPQEEAVLGLYGSPDEFHQRRQAKGLLTLVSLAALLFAMGVLLLIGYNWESMPAAAKAIAVLSSVVAAHGAGLILRFKVGFRRMSEAAFFFGCLLYGAGIWLIAQIFHISGHDPDGFWWWAVGVLPFALALDTLLMHALFVGLVGVWAGYEVLGFVGSGAWLFGRISAVPNGAYGLLPLAAPGVWWAYRKGSAGALALYVPLLTWWVLLQPFAWKLEANPVYFIGAVGGLLLLIAEAHRDGSAMAIPYRFYGAGLTAGALMVLGVYAFNSHSGGPTDGLRGVYQTLAIVALAVVVLAEMVVVRRRSRTKPSTAAEEAVELVQRQWVPCSLIAVMAGLSLWDATGGGPALTTVVANAATFFFTLWLIKVGLRDDRAQPFASGVLLFLLWAVLRYIDLFGAFGGMLGAALVFFLCGATLFGMALLWRQRKAVHRA